MPRGTVTISGDWCAPYKTATCYVPETRTIYTADYITWHPRDRHLILLHELGHAVDFQNLRPGHRRAFRSALGLPCKWWDESLKGCDPLPGEMFAEQYAACAAGISRWRMIPNDYGWFYDYAPPAPWVRAGALRPDPHGALKLASVPAPGDVRALRYNSGGAMTDTRSPKSGRDYRTDTTVTHSTKAHWLALVLVDHLGPRIAEAVRGGILQELGGAESLENMRGRGEAPPAAVTE